MLNRSKSKGRTSRASAAGICRAGGGAAVPPQTDDRQDAATQRQRTGRPVADLQVEAAAAIEPAANQDRPRSIVAQAFDDPAAAVDPGGRATIGGDQQRTPA